MEELRGIFLWSQGFISCLFKSNLLEGLFPWR